MDDWRRIRAGGGGQGVGAGSGSFSCGSIPRTKERGANRPSCQFQKLTAQAHQWFQDLRTRLLNSGRSTPVLHATPRRYLKPQKESVLAHSFVRFLALTAAFMVWGFSVVASASISTTVPALAGNSEREVTSLGFNLLLAAVPLVVPVLWMALIVRCAWFLRRLRGWRQNPEDSRLPKKFLRHSPQLRRVVVGLAHPGLLLVAGLGTSVLALFLGAVELTLNVIA
jgi:hypothetical protein